MWQDRHNDQDDPLIHAIRTVAESNTVTSRLVREYIRDEVRSLNEAMKSVTEGIVRNDSSRHMTYKIMNPDFAVHCIYTTRHTINETHRLSFTQFRVSGHSLVCETGRWNRRGRGRLPLEERLCSCGHIHTERHVVQHCSSTLRLRQLYDFSTIEDLFSDKFSPDMTCKIINEILNVYK